MGLKGRKAGYGCVAEGNEELGRLMEEGAGTLCAGLNGGIERMRDQGQHIEDQAAVHNAYVLRMQMQGMQAQSIEEQHT
jgi:hypothetical protein